MARDLRQRGRHGQGEGHTAVRTIQPGIAGPAAGAGPHHAYQHQFRVADLSTHSKEPLMPPINANSAVRIWGLATGLRSTTGCARGAFAAREYPTLDAAQRGVCDWLTIIVIERAQTPSPPSADRM